MDDSLRHLAQEAPEAPATTPAQVWIDSWVAFLSDRLPVIFLVVVLVAGIALIARARGGVGKVIAFGIGAGLVFLLLTNVEAVSNFFGDELPIGERPTIGQQE